MEPRDGDMSHGLVISITVGVDGRIYCHDLPPELLPVLTEWCAPDPELDLRQEAAGRLECGHE